MAIQGIEQPEIIQIDDALRLRKYDGVHDFALTWYQDEETVWLVDGKRNPYTLERLDGMYHYLDKRGEVYFIENPEASCVAGSYAKNRKIFGFLSRVGDFDILSADLEFNEIFGLREEEILRALCGLQLLRYRCTGLVFLIVGGLARVNGNIDLHLSACRVEELREVFFRDKLHHSFPLSCTTEGSTSSWVKLMRGCFTSVSSPA